MTARSIAACGALLAAVPALADQRTRSTDWTLTLGVEGRVLPQFEGSRNDVLRPVPVFSFRRAGTPQRFRSPRDGGGAALIDNGPFKFGPAIKVKLPRKESEDVALRGLGNVDWTLEAGGFAEFWPSDWLRTRLELRQGFGGHKGLAGDLSADLVVPLTERLTLSGGPRLSATNAAAVSPYYSITSGQSAASGLPVYSAGGGLKSWGAGAQVSYQIDPGWRSYWFIEYEQLAGDAAKSPLVTQRGSINQIQVGIGITRSFDIPGLW
ncbi:MipA/OmpV family protein [Undibacter mobilis]|nr:MipA/OmpV family protein [Undibacter mobilis]